MDHLFYKAIHENFTSNHTGSTPLETFAVVLPPLVGGSIATALRSVFGMATRDDGQNCLTSFLLEFTCLILPAILSFTILSDHIFSLTLALLVIWSLLLACTSVSAHATPNLFFEVFQQKFLYFFSLRFPSKHRSYITNFRSFTNILTVLCILAVDLTIFPRRFAKTETFGYGLMDIGVGLFVVSNALVSPNDQSDIQLLSLLYRLFRSNFPLIVLGCVRIILISSLEYQEHVTEYGTHWNFFFTLAAIKILSRVIMRFMAGTFQNYVLFSGLLIVCYEFILNMGLCDWIFSDAPRLDLISANREGVFSLCGYIALYFSGLSIKTFIKRVDKSTGESNILLFKYFFCSSCVFWISTIICGNIFGISRRLANVGYCLWVLSFSMTFIAFFVFCESVALLQNMTACSFKKMPSAYPPMLCEAVNYNGLLFFLLGNVMTGLINVFVRTLFLGPISGISVLTSYMFVLCLIVTILHHKKIVLKF